MLILYYLELRERAATIWMATFDRPDGRWRLISLVFGGPSMFADLFAVMPAGARSAGDAEANAIAREAADALMKGGVRRMSEVLRARVPDPKAAESLRRRADDLDREFAIHGSHRKQVDLIAVQQLSRSLTRVLYTDQADEGVCLWAIMLARPEERWVPQSFHVIGDPASFTPFLPE